MKNLGLNLLLIAATAALLFICYRSIMDPVEFDKERELRQKDVVARLIDIRTAQVEYRNAHGGAYTDNFDTLINFIKTAQMPIVLKVGELNDEQLNDGLTESKVLEMIAKAEKTGKWGDVDKYGLRDFRRDTTWIALIDTIYPKTFVADSLRYVPYGNGAQFEMATSCDTTKAGSALWLFEARTPFETYLSGINDPEMKNLKVKTKKMNRYCGLKVGDIEQPNNNSGNWE